MGKLVGDEKMVVEGEAAQVKGKAENTVGGVKDTAQRRRRRHQNTDMAKMIAAALLDAFDKLIPAISPATKTSAGR